MLVKKKIIGVGMNENYSESGYIVVRNHPEIFMPVRRREFKRCLFSNTNNYSNLVAMFLGLTKIQSFDPTVDPLEVRTSMPVFEKHELQYIESPSNFSFVDLDKLCH